MVEEDCSYVVEMSVQGKQTSPRLIRPDLDLVVVASRNEEGLCLVEIDASNRPIVFFEAINKGSHAIVPQLYSRRV